MPLVADVKMIRRPGLELAALIERLVRCREISKPLAEGLLPGLCLGGAKQVAMRSVRSCFAVETSRGESWRTKRSPPIGSAEKMWKMAFECSTQKETPVLRETWSAQRAVACRQDADLSCCLASAQRHVHDLTHCRRLEGSHRSQHR